MKKSGYTLAEILIALAIAGIVAGLVLPMAGKIRPNANKMAFLHTYDSIVQLTHSIAADENFYPEINVNEDKDDNINYANYPLWNIHPAYPYNNTYEQEKKYCQILAEGLKADSNACSNNTKTPFGNQKSFTTPNGVDFWVNTVRGEEGRPTLTQDDDFAIYQSSVHFDVNGIDQGENCIYNAGTCPHPDRFTLFVASDGKVVAADKMSKHYLDTRTNFRFNKDEVPNTTELTALVEADRKKKINYIEEILKLEPEKPNIDPGPFACGDEYGDSGRIVNCISIADGSVRLKSTYPPASNLKVSVHFKLDEVFTKTFQFDFFKGENYSVELYDLSDYRIKCGNVYDSRCTKQDGSRYDFAFATNSVGQIMPSHDDKYQYMSEGAVRNDGDLSIEQ